MTHLLEHGASRIKKTVFVVSSAVALLTLVVYLPALQNDFINLDDDIYVYDNPLIRSFNLNLVKTAVAGIYAGNWHPLTVMSHALDYRVWGLNPVGHHLTSIILHVLNALLATVLVIRLIGVEKGGIVAGVTAGLLFGVHPIHVESVAWVSERKDVLYAFFYILSLLAYVRYAEKSTDRKSYFFLDGHYLASLGLFFLSALSKPMAVTLPLVLVILDWHPLGRFEGSRSGRIFAEKAPFFIIGAATAAITLLVQSSGGALPSYRALPLFVRVLVGFNSLILYLGRMILPLGLSPLYPYPGDATLFSFKYLLAVLLVFGITIACIITIKRQRLWMAVWGYYVISLLPVIGIVQAGAQATADRYTYLPGFALFVPAGLCIARLMERIHAKSSRLLFIVVLTTIAFSLSYSTQKQIKIWKNSIALFSRVIEISPDAAMAHNNLAIAYISDGLTDRAIQHLQSALSIEPEYAEAHNNLGNAYILNNLTGPAEAHYRAAIRLKPDYIDAHYNLGILYFEEGSFDSAAEQLETVLRLKPGDNQANEFLKIIYNR